MFLTACVIVSSYQKTHVDTQIGSIGSKKIEKKILYHKKKTNDLRLNSIFILLNWNSVGVYLLARNKTTYLIRLTQSKLKIKLP